MGGSINEGNESGEEHDNSAEDMDTEVPSIQPYTLNSGCSAPLSGNKPLDYFSLFVDQRMLQDIVDQTNLNIAQYIEYSGSPLKDPAVAQGGAQYRRA